MCSSDLYRDIRGRREDLKPVFVIGGVYDIKNPFFHNLVEVSDNIPIERVTPRVFLLTPASVEIDGGDVAAQTRGRFANQG